MSERNYRNAFLAAVVVCGALAAALAYVAWGGHARGAVDNNPVIARSPEASQAAQRDSNSSAGALPLSPVRLDPQRMQAIGLRTATVERRQVSQELRVPGNVEVDQRRLAYVQTRFAGWIQKVFANAMYQYVRKGQPLFTIYSPDLVSTEQEYLLAKQNQETVSGGRQATARRESDWLLQAAADRLRQFGVPASEIARLERTASVQHEITVEAPVSGYVTEFNALPNQYIQAETRLYTIADLSTVWVSANVFQADVGALKPGMPASVTVDAYRGRSFRGRIDQILPQVDAATRTLPVRFVFSNAGVALKPGMYVNVSMAIPLGRRLVAPRSGVLQSGTREIAFVDRGGGHLEPREVQTGARVDDEIVIIKGLEAGERIVSSANFLVDSESQLQSAMNAFAPPPAVESRAEEQIRIELSTNPSPPRAGANLIQVTLTDREGKAVAGAEVEATFFMAAMPAMGMGAMRDVVTLNEKSAGKYEGSLQLQSGGTWQVTVAARRGGQPMASKQLSLTATGGVQ